MWYKCGTRYLIKGRQWDPEIPVAGSGCRDADVEGRVVVAGSRAMERIVIDEILISKNI